MSEANGPAQSSLGFGVGLRVAHVDALLSNPRPAVDWLEALTENFLVPGGRPRHTLHRLRERYPVALHGVSLSIGGTDPLNVAHLHAVRQLADEIEAEWVSDHLCWTGVDGINLHELLPLSYTEESLRHVSTRITQAQDILGRALLIENVSSYLEFAQNEMTEWEFLNELCARTDCLLLLDVNNVYVSSFNHGFDAATYLRSISPTRVHQLHLAGHRREGAYLIDTHDAPVAEAVWSLYAAVVGYLGMRAVMIERDDNLPPLAELLDELNRAREIAAAARRAA
jgi:uncharacterized protein